MDGGAANASLMWFLWKVLATCQPTSIVEFGSGQSTKLFARYARLHPSANVCTLEHNADWMSVLAPQIALEGKPVEYVHAPLVSRSFVTRHGNIRVNARAYQVPTGFGKRRFQLILIDGPDTGHGVDYTRDGALEFIPDILDDRFVLIIDDAERFEERRLANRCQTILKLAGRDFARFEIEAVKTQVVFCSPNWSFLRSI
jgi:hypothetical protein